MGTLIVALTLIVITPPLAGIALAAAALGVRDRPGGLYDRLQRSWATALMRAADVRVELHDAERVGGGEPRVFVSNHVSWFDVLALASRLPRYKFVAKSELEKVPIFGAGARAVGTVYIERENRKSAFESYRIAAEKIRSGTPVVVYPEGTRGTSYALRPFKKGPFVLAIAAGVPVVPVVVYGTIGVIRRGSWWLRRGERVHLHFLEPIPTAGLAYADRERLTQLVWTRMATALRELYGVESPAPSWHASSDTPTPAGASPPSASPASPEAGAA